MNIIKTIASGTLLALAIAVPVYAVSTQIGLSADGTLLNYGTSATGSMVCTLDNTGVTNLTTVLDTPNGGITTQATPDTSGNCKGATFTGLATPTPGATTPTLLVGAAAGSGATVSFVAGSNLQSGAVLITAGTAPTLGTVLTVTFSIPFSRLPVVIITPYGDNAAAAGPYVRSATTIQAVIGVRAAMLAGLNYVVQYVVN